MSNPRNNLRTSLTTGNDINKNTLRQINKSRSIPLERSRSPFCLQAKWNLWHSQFFLMLEESNREKQEAERQENSRHSPIIKSRHNYERIG